MNKKLKFTSAFLATSLLIIDGKWYNFDNNGYWI